MKDTSNQPYNPLFFEHLCPILKDIIPSFPERTFIFRVFDKDWPDLTPEQQTSQIARSLHRVLPQKFSEAAALIILIAKQLELQKMQRRHEYYAFLPEFIALFGQSHFQISMIALATISPVANIESALRSFLSSHPQQTMNQIVRWSSSPDISMQRLARVGFQSPFSFLAAVSYNHVGPYFRSGCRVANSLSGVAEQSEPAE